MRSRETIITGAMLILITYTLGLSLVSQAYPAAQTSQTLSNTGSIQIQTSVGISVYSDSQCNTPKTSISWGILEPGANQSITCYIKNEGNIPTTISLQTSNWTPITAPTYLDLNWNYNDQPINPDSVIQVTLTLVVSENIEGITNFSFDITILGTSK
jgi:hypothetical protein